METWYLILLSLSLYLPLAFLICPLLHRSKRRPELVRGLPPGPPVFPVVGNILWLRRSFSDIDSILRSLRAKYGPVVTLQIGSRRSIFVSDRVLAHKFLVQHGAVFADRPRAPAANLNPNRQTVGSAPYGPLWRVLRRNLTAEILHPSRIKLYSHGRVRVLGILLGVLRPKVESGEPVMVVESFQYAMFCLLVFMCFGEMLEETAVRDIEKVQRDCLLYVRKLNVFAFFPGIAKYFFRNRLMRMIQEIRQRQEDVFLPLIKVRRELRGQREGSSGENSFQYSYVDSLLDLEIPDDEGQNRRLTDEEMASLCSEFLNAGTDTTSTALQWIMANLVKHQRVQAKLIEEIAAVVGEGTGRVREEDLGKLPYLRAVVMEGLRLHPPGHFVVPHAAKEDALVEGYVIPKDASINFTVAEFNRDEAVWEQPMGFRPERFLPGGEGDGVDITGSREIKMMPFGVGRRICPGLGLALLHLEYFVANLVREFEWKAMEGEEVDLREKVEYMAVMKNPLRARILPHRQCSR